MAIHHTKKSKEKDDEALECMYDEGDDDDDEDGVVIENRYGYLRQFVDVNDNPYLTRFGGTTCNTVAPIGDPAQYEQCLNEHGLSVTGFHDCYSVHAQSHAAIGGTRPYRDWQPEV